MSELRLSEAEIVALAQDALVAHGAAFEAAEAVARAVAEAEPEDNRSCGLYYVPVFCRQLAAGGIDGRAGARVERSARDGIAVDPGLLAEIRAPARRKSV